MQLLSVKEITVAARSSPLSRAQVKEVLELLQVRHANISFISIWLNSTGDLDKTTSLKGLEKSNFFTQEIDDALLRGECRIGIHSAKDLPDPLPEGLEVIAYTEGLDSSDVIVLKDGESLMSLPSYAKIGTSSLRREKNLKEMRFDLECVDIRGTIEERLSLLDQGKVDGVIVAKAALLRLKLVCNEVKLAGEVTPMQGRLAIVAKVGDREMKDLFSFLHVP